MKIERNNKRIKHCDLIRHASSFEIKLTIYLLLSIILFAKSNISKSIKLKEDHLKPYYSESDLNAEVMSTLISTKDVEDNIKKLRQKKETRESTPKMEKKRKKIH